MLARRCSFYVRRTPVAFEEEHLSHTLSPLACDRDGEAVAHPSRESVVGSERTADEDRRFAPVTIEALDVRWRSRASCDGRARTSDRVKPRSAESDRSTSKRSVRQCAPT